MRDPETEAFTRHVLDATIRIGALALLAGWCFAIVAPFVTLLAWAAILAVLIYPAHAWLRDRLRGREAIAAALITLGALALLIVPIASFTGTLVDSSRDLVAQVETKTLRVPAPPDSVAAWPVIGSPLHALWNQASENLGAVLERLEPQITAGLKWLLASAAGTGLGLLQFVVSIVIAGILLTQSERAPAALRAVGRTLAGERGGEFVALATDTLRSVARGVLGISLIQAFLAGIGFVAVGLPGAGIWALLCLVFAVIQIGPGLVLIPSAIYVFSVADTGIAVVYLIWAIFVTLIDNVLKPLLLGRGLRVPIVVIFLGAIGGLLSSGILGLFVGPVVLSMGYELGADWLRSELETEAEAPAE